MACNSYYLCLFLLLFLLLCSSTEPRPGQHSARNRPVNPNPSAPRRKKSNNRPDLPAHLTAPLTSGVNLGIHVYLVDVLIGTPPKRFSLILDTGSDLTWVHCSETFLANHFDPRASNLFRNVMCRDPRCSLVEPPPDASEPCDADDHSQTCPYYYFYADSSDTTGDFAAETFAVGLLSPDGNYSDFVKVENLVFGCGRRDKVNFGGAASGVLGLGRGPLSFSTQLRYRYGNAFSYCLVDPSIDRNATSKLVFGLGREISGYGLMNFTSVLTKRPNLDVTYYYLGIESISVGGEVLDLPEEIWKVSHDGSGGTIIDSGVTISLFVGPAYEAIKEAFLKKIRGYSVIEDEMFDLCYHAPGSQKLDMPGFGLVFHDGAEWNFPAENVFIRFEPEGTACLAMSGIGMDRFSIIGNHLQKNFQVLYDREESRLGHEMC